MRLICLLFVVVLAGCPVEEYPPPLAGVCVHDVADGGVGSYLNACVGEPEPCVWRTDECCAASPDCPAKGLCSGHDINGLLRATCVPGSADDCRSSLACHDEGLCCLGTALDKCSLCEH